MSTVIWIYKKAGNSLPRKQNIVRCVYIYFEAKYSVTISELFTITFFYSLDVTKWLPNEYNKSFPF